MKNMLNLYGTTTGGPYVDIPYILRVSVEQVVEAGLVWKIRGELRDAVIDIVYQQVEDNVNSNISDVMKSAYEIVESHM